MQPLSRTASFKTLKSKLVTGFILRKCSHFIIYKCLIVEICHYLVK